MSIAAGDEEAARIVVGIGATTTATVDEVAALVAQALAEGQIIPAAVCAVATHESRRDHPAIEALAWPVVSFSPEALAAVIVPNPSARVASASGTPSVAEAAALLAAGHDAEIIVPKRTSAHASVALARPSNDNPGRIP